MGAAGAGQPATIVVMAGLPGTGKSTLARQLAERLPAALLDKDVVRAALFAPNYIEYSTRQDDFCVDVLLEAAAYLIGHGLARWVILDGRPFARRYQRERVAAAAARVGATARTIECGCAEATALGRLAADAARRAHPAGNRDAALYAALKAQWEPIPAPKLVVDTDQDVASCVARCLAELTGRPAGAEPARAD